MSRYEPIRRTSPWHLEARRVPHGGSLRLRDTLVETTEEDERARAVAPAASSPLLRSDYHEVDSACPRARAPGLIAALPRAPAGEQDHLHLRADARRVRCSSSAASAHDHASAHTWFDAYSLSGATMRKAQVSRPRCAAAKANAARRLSRALSSTRTGCELVTRLAAEAASRARRAPRSALHADVRSPSTAPSIASCSAAYCRSGSSIRNGATPGGRRPPSTCRPVPRARRPGRSSTFVDQRHAAVEIEPSGEHREPSERRTLFVAQQAPAPVDRRHARWRAVRCGPDDPAVTTST